MYCCPCVSLFTAFVKIQIPDTDTMVLKGFRVKCQVFDTLLYICIYNVSYNILCLFIMSMKVNLKHTLGTLMLGIH